MLVLSQSAMSGQGEYTAKWESGPSDLVAQYRTRFSLMLELTCTKGDTFFWSLFTDKFGSHCFLFSTVLINVYVVWGYMYTDAC